MHNRRCTLTKLAGANLAGELGRSAQKNE